MSSDYGLGTMTTTTLYRHSIQRQIRYYANFDWHETFVQAILKLLKIKSNYLIRQETYVLDIC